MADWVQDSVAEGAEKRSLWRSRTAALLAAQAGTFFLWSPLCLIAGIWAYFALSREPPPLAFTVVALLITLLFFLARARRSVIARVLLLMLIGFALAKIRTEWVAAPGLTAPTGEVSLTGVVEDFEARGPKRAVAILRIRELAGEGVTRIPAMVRVTINGSARLKAGQVIKARAQLFPLPPPATPGGYDYGRSLWFEGIGATGRLYGDILVEGSDGSLWLRFKAGLEDLRDAIGQRIRAVLPRERSGIAEALITGERGTIPRAVNESLQTSGLAHILSISGLHMSLVAGSCFWLVRALLALSPTLATSYPIKKWAAVAGLFMGLVYMVLAGASVATQRSYIMLAVMFIAILVNRPALSMRNLAIAALIILVAFPEAAVTASLQMSFLAVMGLLAFHEIWSRWLAEGDVAHRGLFERMLRFSSKTVFAAAFTTLAAGGFSSIAAAYHFGRLAPYSLIANVLALPAISVIVMPMALIAVLLMPFGLESWPLWLMDQGLVIVQSVSDWVVTLPEAKGLIPALPLTTAILLGLAATILCLARGILRGLALPVAAVAFVVPLSVQRPDIHIEGTAKNVAIRAQNGELVPAHPRRGRFTASLWLRMEGDNTTPAEAAHRPGWSCADGVCRGTVKNKRVIYLSDEKLAMTIPCAEADILLAAFPLRGRCRAAGLRIDRFSVWRSGAHALYLDEDGIRIETSRGLQGPRPWAITPEPRRKDTSR